MRMWGLHIDPLYIVLFIVTLAISGVARLLVRSQFGNHSAIRTSAASQR